ncbi:HAD-IB family phosphatase [Sphingomonas lacunae]|uniref:HAD-IB family phosphatase n=1 Tax=Sphingomonas lacunae TaxID=2698828 RepID=A0A6M4AU20_9SPHN|nr:HAD-IB family phosphatase [Sphingomonas lacunae]QJQ32575.1 HAD-IB family phosphatase [Sphingomonas lacunae]
MKQADPTPEAAGPRMTTPSAAKRIAIYDVDRTLTRRPTWWLFLVQSMAYRAPWRALLIPLLVPIAILYVLGLIPRRLMKQAMHRVALGPAIPRNEAVLLADRFAQGLFANGLHAQGLAQIEQERADGWHIMLATAAADFYIEPLARRLQVTDWVATRSLWHGDSLSHRIDGENCYGREKLRRIQQLLEQRGLQRDQLFIRFYSDDVSDRPLCDWVDQPVATNPGKAMEQLARQKGWLQLDWRPS